MLNPTDFVITAATALPAIINPVVDGEQKGMGLVPRDYNLYPREMFDPPSQLPLIPRSEWPERIRDQIANKSRLSDFRTWPSLDQNGQGYSHSEDTECLTEKGWVAWPDWNHTDLLATVNPITHQMEFQAPTEWHAYEYNDEMYFSTNRRLDFGVTRNHRMLVRKWDEARRTLSDFYTFQRADELGWYVGMMSAPAGCPGIEMVELEVPGDRRYDGDDFLAMLSLIVSDGYAGGSESTRDTVSFCCFNAKRYAAVAALAARVGFTEQSNRRGVWNRHAPALADWVRQYCYTGPDLRSHNKCVPQVVKVASQRQIGNFLSFYGDQTHGASTPQFYTTSKRLVDDLQELHLRIGKRGHIGNCPPRQSVIKSGESTGNTINSRECFVLTVGKEDRLCIDRKKHIETDHYKGLVYCATVPNGNLVTRRNGSVLISGNCWAYSTSGAVMLGRSASNQPYIRLSAHAIACVIKGWKDEGGWCGLSAKFHKERGCPSVALWPEKSMSRSYDKDETWANAALHKVTEDWVDLTRPVYSQNLTFDQMATCFLCNIACALDFNHWGHSVAGMDLVDGVSSFNLQLTRADSGKLLTLQEFDILWATDVTAGFAPRILNSWTDSWGDRGTGVLAGSKGIPDGAVALRVTGGSAT